MNHIIESQQFDQKFINKIFSIADKLEKKTETSLKGKIMASLFYEPSTRTRFSFESAMLKLGGSVITTENAKEFSSAAKGETLEDSITEKKNIMKDAAALIKKYETQQGKVRNNREYDAISKEIELQQLDIQLAEKRIREAQRNIEAKKEVTDLAKKRLEQKLKELDANHHRGAWR